VGLSVRATALEIGRIQISDHFYATLADLRSR
jgi:hypothetical protein